MFLNKYLTEYDDSLSGETYIDPLGMQIIWSAYGREIFHNRVNSISNDVRNYTLNLFNHYITRHLIQNEGVQLSKRLTDVYGGKDTLFFKYACLLYLENLFVYSILKFESKAIDSSGVLGISNGRRRWNESEKNPNLIFSHDKPGQLLVRQIGLGVSGRYKTPLMEIGYFDARYHYFLPSAENLWQEAEKFILGNTSLKSLADMLVEHMRELLSRNSKQPETHFGTVVPEKLPSSYAKAFASPGTVGRYARVYWLSVTGLNTGAAGALLAVLDENARRDQPDEFSPQRLIELTDRTTLLPEEARKIEHIEQLEPFLADAMLLFNLLTDKKAQSLEAVTECWYKFGRDEQTLPRRAQHLRENLGLISVTKESAWFRLNTLLQFADTQTLLEQILLLVDYHGKVMIGRGQQPWLTLTDTATKVHARPMAKPSEDEWPNGVWYHSYYLPQFKWLVRGYQGTTA